MSIDETDTTREARDRELEALYAQLTTSAARLMVVHEAGNILSSTHDAEEVARGLLDVIAEAAFAGVGCVASLDRDELKILATRGLEDHEVDDLAGDAGEASVWFSVADAEGLRRAADLAAELGLTRDAEDAEDAEEEVDDAGVEASVDDVEGAEEDDAAGFEASADDAEGAEEDDAAPAPSTAPHFDIYLPLRVEDRTLGVLALGARVDGAAFSGDDEALARSLSSHLALALNHAYLFAERTRRIEQLNALLKISRELTSTLDLERVLSTIAQMVGMVVPNRRTVVALVTGGKVSIRGSSDPDFNVKEAGRDPFLPVLGWAQAARQNLNTCREMLADDAEAAGRDVLLPWLSAEDGPRGLAVLPLEDDQGPLGLLAVETDEDRPPLEDDDEELVTILANQTTVAIRNAELYQQVPMIGVLEPMLAKARRVRRGSHRKLVVRSAVLASLLGVGFLVPLPSWVAGDAEVRPAQPVALRAGTEGTVDEVLVREGETVRAGTVVARLRRDELLVQLADTRAGIRRAAAEGARARAEGDFATYRARQAALTELQATERLLTERLQATDLAAPTDGVILTPDVERLKGIHLARGQTFLDMADLSTMDVEVEVPEQDLRWVEPGRKARLKVHAFPGRTFRGEVVLVAPEAGPNGNFRVTVRLPNPDGALRPGMTGRAHLVAPAEPVLRKWLRPLARRLRLKFWV
jgi:GAF domain-containing protein